MARTTGLYGADKGFNVGSSAPMVDIAGHQGYEGHLPDLSSYVTNGSYVRRNLVAIVLATPKGFDHLPDGELWHKALKAIIETQSKSISGIVSTLNLEFTENTIGGAGEVQSDIANVTRTPSTPTHGAIEKPGKPISRLMAGWILNLLGDPETKVPRIMTMASNQGKDIDLLPDDVSMTVLYFEPDHTFRHVLEAWLCTDMKPKSGPVTEGSREMTAAGAPLEHSLEFTCIQQVGANVNALAQRELDKMNLGGVNPTDRPAIVDEIASGVSNVDSGYAEGIEEAGETFGPA